MPDPSVKHEEEGIESQLIAHGSSRVVALQERVDRLEVAPFNGPLSRPFYLYLR